MFKDLWRDLGHAVRSLAKARTFTFVCVVSLGIGMAPVIAIPYASHLGPGYGSPIVATLGGVRQIVTITQGKVVGVNAGNGMLLWERPFVASDFTNAMTPLLYGETIVVGGAGGREGSLRRRERRRVSGVPGRESHGHERPGGVEGA